MHSLVDHLKSLHTAAIDARNGYQEALKDAEGKGLTPLFQDMIQLHDTNAEELAEVLNESGEKPDNKGSFMTTVHKTIMSVRSLFDGLGESVLPGLIDGEERNAKHYADAFPDVTHDRKVGSLLERQQKKILVKIAAMQRMKLDA